MDEIDLAEQLNRQEYERRIAAVQKALNRTGEKECIDCGEEIPEARRKNMPSAVRCVICHGDYKPGLFPSVGAIPCGCPD